MTATATIVMMTKAIVLFAHGSRDPLWHKPIEAVAAQLRLTAPADVRVACAYLELSTPDLAVVTQELAGLGILHIAIVPMFLGVGRHAREDLPTLVDGLRLQYPDLAFTLAPAVGENTKLVHLLAEIALDTLK